MLSTAGQVRVNGLDDPEALKRFLGEVGVPTPRPKVYEDDLAENRADHNRECNASPWGSFKRIVAKKDRDACIPSGWTALAQTTGPENMVAVSTSALLSKEECAAIIAEAEAEGTWTKAFPHASKEREATMPDRIKADLLPTTLAWLGKTVSRRLCPAIEQAFPESEVKAQNLRLYQATILRYAADTCENLGSGLGVSTPVHQDFSFMTMTVPLNDPSEYEGGGTWIHPLQRAVRPPIGHALAHSGRVWHAGDSVTKGTRYALALFFHSGTSHGVDHGRRSEQRATRLIADGKLEEACALLEFSLRAYREAAVARALRLAERCTPEQALLSDSEQRALEVDAEGQALWGVLANLRLQLGQVEESGLAEVEFVKHVERLRRQSQDEGCDPPGLAGALQNLRVLLRRKAELRGGAATEESD